MTARSRFWQMVFLIVGGVVLLASSLIVVFWNQLAAVEQQVLLDLLQRHAIVLLIFFSILATIITLALDGVYRHYIVAVARLAEELQTILTVNPNHRIAPVGGPDAQLLVQALNTVADRNAERQAGLADRIRLAGAEAEREKNILAAVLSELPQGVMICNPDGQILLYNRQATHLLRQAAAADDPGRCIPGNDAECFIGLGRSIFGVVDRHLILHAMDEIGEKLARKEPGAIARFGMASAGGKLLGVDMLPIVDAIEDAIEKLGGFILMIEEITQQLERSRRAREAWHHLSGQMRAALGAICGSADLLRRDPPPRDPDRRALEENIDAAAWELAAVVERADRDFQGQIASQWPLIPLAAGELVAQLSRKAREQLDISLQWAEAASDLWVRVDSYAITLALLFLLARIRQMTGCGDYSGRVDSRDQLVQFNLFWQGPPLRLETLRDWEGQRVALEGETLPFSLGELLRHHEGTLWSQPAGRFLERSSLRLLLPSAGPEGFGPLRPAAMTLEGRPVFYDFDLFRRTDLTALQENRHLTDLRYTVFDTETTGLDPSGGDEIVSIGAVRIVNGRLLTGERFDQLVDPGRPVPIDSIRFHGIDPRMLVGQHKIGPVLQRFGQFVEDTVLVAHNAAFDMRMLQISEDRSGVKFANPVLDTLLLSAAVYPAHGDHSLEAIALRLGIRIVGRHTALGDAIMTGEIFLKLIPLLAHKGIFTLKEAVDASRRTYLARLKY